MSTTDTTIPATPFAAFPNAPIPTTLEEARALLEDTRRLLAEECRKSAMYRDALIDLRHVAQVASKRFAGVSPSQIESFCKGVGL